MANPDTMIYKGILIPARRLALKKNTSNSKDDCRNDSANDDTDRFWFHNLILREHLFLRILCKRNSQ